MKKFILMMFILLAFFVCMVADAAPIIRPYAQTTTNQVWWVQRKYNQENVEWIDHTGHTNTARRVIGSTEDFKGGSGRGKSVTIAADLTVKLYTLDYAYVDEGWSIANVAPGTYDLVNGKWYTDMTDEEKTAMWVAYTNKVIQARIEAENERKAPAKFDVTRTPDEYEAYLLNSRDMEDLAPADRADIRREVNVYRREWIRVNQPELYDPPLPSRWGGGKMTEQQKIRSRRGIPSR